MKKGKKVIWGREGGGIEGSGWGIVIVRGGL